MPNLLWKRIFFLESILQESVESVDLPHFFLLTEWLDWYCLGAVGFDAAGCSIGRLQFLQTRLHDFLEMDVCWSDSVDGPLFYDARPVLEGDLRKT